MEVNKIQEELARLIELVDGWAGSHDVPGIERDLVLDKLKKLYEAIRFANFDEGDSSASASVAAQQSVAEVAPVSEISIDLDDLLAEPVRDFLPESAAMPEALDAPVGESAAVPESAPSVKPVSASAVTEPEPEPVLVVASAPVAEPDPVLADESAPESVPVSESAPAAESIAVAVAVSVTSVLSRQYASMEGQSDKASGTGHDAAVRTGREGLAGSSAGQVVAPSSEADAESKQKVVVSDSLFDLDDLVIRHREKRRVIMSLYETDGPQEAAASKIPADIDGSLHRPVISSAAFKSGCVNISCRLPVQFSHQVRITGKSVTDPVRKFFCGRNDVLKGNRGIFHIRGINGNQPCSILRGGDTDPQLSFDVCSLHSRHPSFYKGVKSQNSYSNSTSGEISSQSFFRRIL